VIEMSIARPEPGAACVVENFTKMQTMWP